MSADLRHIRSLLGLTLVNVASENLDSQGLFEPNPLAGVI